MLLVYLILENVYIPCSLHLSFLVLIYKSSIVDINFTLDK
jgi:hypothetical protein